jgi:hypothetical protein
MKGLMKKIDLFCYRHPRFGIRNLMLYVVIANVVIWIFSMMDTSGLLVSALAFSPAMIMKGQVWRLVTFALIPNDFSWLALIMFYFYYFIGNTLEAQWGPGKFTIYFFTGILLTVIYGFIIYFATGENVTVYAEYIYLSMFFSFATIFPDTVVLFMFIIPMKMKWLAYIDAAFFLYGVFTMQFPMNLLPVVAVLNYLIFCGDWLFALFRPSRVSTKAKTINYKRAARKINREQNSAPYTRKCAVCGRTDAEYPDLEFRYCSQCAGYHCFCQDHINNHVHFTE